MCARRVPRVQTTRDADCRCLSTQVDYTTGASVAPARQPLKLLMRDRRVDSGVRYSPVFGRYGFIPGSDRPPPVHANLGDVDTPGRCR